jgi:hypothetical protein
VKGLDVEPTEYRVSRVDRLRVLEAGDAVRGVGFGAVGPDADGQAGCGELLGGVPDDVGQRDLGHLGPSSPSAT